MLMNDLFHIYSLKHNTSTDGMLQDYRVDSRLDRDALNNYILLELGDRRPYYNDSEVMKFAIDTWFDTHYRNIQVLIDTLLTDYDPLKPNEFWEEKNQATATNIEHQNTLEQNYVPGTSKITTGSVKESGTNTTEQLISAYNSSGYQEQGKTIETPGNTTTYNDYEVESKANSNSENGFDGKQFSTKGDFTKQRTITTDIGDSAENTTDEALHHWGREDVADLKRKEWNAARYNIYQWICDNLGNKICLSIF